MMTENISLEIEKDKNNIQKFLSTLVRTPSQNGINSESKVADKISEVLEKIGFKVKKVGTYERPSLMTSFGIGKKSIILNAHMDTVPIGDESKWYFNPFSATAKNGKLYGRGAADSKAGIAQIVYATKHLIKYESELNGKVVLAFDSDEESGNFTGMKELLKSGLKGDFCIIAYPGNEELMIGSRGVLRLSLKTYGEIAHTGSREKKGKNAIYDMFDVINLLRRIKFPYKKDLYFSFGHKLTVSMINGGNAINLVPDKCEAKIDMRTLPNMDDKEVIKLIQSKINKDLPNVKFSIDELLFYPAYRINEKHRVVGTLLTVSQRILGKKPRLACAGAASIGNLLTMKNIPTTCGFGAEFGNAHSYNEWVSITSVVDMTKVYAQSILHYF